MENKQNRQESTMTEKDRWMLVAAICTAIGSAINLYFAGRK